MARIASEGANAGRRAQVFYATDAAYAIAILVFVRQLLELGLGAGIELVALHLPLPSDLVAALRAHGIETREVPPVGTARSAYYRHSWVKLRVLELVEYSR